MEGEVAIRFFESQQRFEAQIREVEPVLAPYAAKFFSLPATMMWALLHLWRDRPTADLVPVALQLAETAMGNHLRLVKQSIDAGGRDVMERKALEMCMKFLGLGACTFRALVRTYRIQRRDFHEPTLNYLIVS